MKQLFLIFCLAAGAFAQTSAEKFNHVQWVATVEPSEAAPGATVLVRLDAVIDAEWHMYSLTTPPGPIPTTIRLMDSTAVDQVAYFEPPALTKFDPNFNANTETYEGKQTFYARVKLKGSVPAGAMHLNFEPRYQTCSGTVCIPPRTRQVDVAVNVNGAAKTAVPAIPAGYIEAKPRSSAPGGANEEGWIPFLALAFGVGLAAIFTPCVFPMIPITMS